MTLMVYNDRMFLAAPFLDASPWLPGGVANRLLQFRPGSCGVLRAGHRHPWCRVPGATCVWSWIDYPPCKVARTDLRAALGGHTTRHRPGSESWRRGMAFAFEQLKGHLARRAAALHFTIFTHIFSHRCNGVNQFVCTMEDACC